ncbi:heparan-alpha-glucosaminide N-acetyltransferase domain-containing protein [Salegentibacter sp. JZCK2]|uniref:acyltransferase family protein n=1 Tax=Salegentibacter tibetensis TaxID=2873600 RepID=UPI001CD0070B|nr:heparan-alpha-glucosaminide N-acetyltransferase domain-containing protein [Salegentibacter tibetensis]MBZ9731452.1 heparan-alpha-glucosaminide N-acetyltransferase domain-containing protein [Salegentibacter tibetensis]
MTENTKLFKQAKTGKNQRYFSLDVLRGLTIALMILVNTPGSWSHIYAPFKHAAWNGFTPTDWVFPSFLFVIGNAMSFSLRKYESISENAFLKKVFKRALLIFLIGLFLNAFPFVDRQEGELVFKNLANMRIMGVLQRIALCYLFASMIIHYLKLKKSIIFGSFILLAYWAIMWFFGDHPNPLSLENNAALKFDQLIFNDENLYKGYGLPFDPEGLLSTLPAIVNVIAGYVAGVFIQKSGNNMATVIKLSISGVLLLVLAQTWDIWFPINKPIWSSSYVLYSTGWTLMVLSTLILIIEIFGFKRWTAFFEAFGKNPLFVYVMSGLVIILLNIIYVNGQALKAWLYENLYLSWLNNYNASLLFATSYMLLMWLLGYLLHKKRIYIKV